MLDKHLAMEALDAALSTGGDFAEIFAEDRRDQAVALQDSHVERVNSGTARACGYTTERPPYTPTPTILAGTAC